MDPLKKWHGLEGHTHTHTDTHTHTVISLSYYPSDVRRFNGVGARERKWLYHMSQLLCILFSAFRV